VRDVSSGLSLLPESASFGYADSVLVFAFYVQDGEVYAGNPEASARYFDVSVRQGNSFGDVKYWYCLALGRGIAKKKTEAIRYFKLSADLGNAALQLPEGPCP
jgi:TPR repeat protein